MKFTVDEMLQKLPLPPTEKWNGGVWDLEAFEKNGVRLFFFAPRVVDLQTQHDKDEFYFIVRGSGEIVIRNNREPCTAGDVFFVEAKVEHRFENFSGDFATWAIFF